MTVDNLLIKKSPSSIWNETLQVLLARIPTSAFYAWFTNLEIVSIEDSKVMIGTPNNFVLDFVSHHYHSQIRLTLSEVLKFPVSVEFCNLDRAMVSHYGNDELPADSLPEPISSIATPEPTIIDTHVALNPNYIFDHFVVGDCNQLAHAACLAVAESPSRNNFNPLVIYGGTGMGKTHLLHAIAHYVKDAETARKVVCRTSEEFTREYIHFVHKNKDSRSFYRVYQDADVLLIDDIQFLAGKKSTQEEFFNIFNNLQQLRKQIVITSDRLPHEIEGLHTRLLSRFDTGLLASMQPPKLETRLAILKKKIQNCSNTCLSEEVLSYVANCVTTNVRELEGTLIKLSAYASFRNLPMTVEIAKQILGDTLRNVNKPVNLKTIIQIVAASFHTPASQLSSQSRKKTVSQPRQIAMYLARELTDNSLHTIGLAFGRDYSTVIHSLKKIEAELDASSELREQVLNIKEQIQRQA